MGTLEILKTFRKQKLRNFNSLIVAKNLKEGTLWDFFLLQNIKKLKGASFGDIKKLSKKSLKAEKTGSLKVPKK